MFAAETVYPLKATERISAIKKEYHVRKQSGKYIAYIVEDKYGLAPVLLGQKLSLLVDVINTLVEDAPDKVSIAGLYHKMHRRDSTTGGYLRNRWKIQPYTLEEATSVFNRVRKVYANAAVIGSRDCYNTVCV